MPPSTQQPIAPAKGRKLLESFLCKKGMTMKAFVAVYQSHATATRSGGPKGVTLTAEEVLLALDTQCTSKKRLSRAAKKAVYCYQLCTLLEADALNKGKPIASPMLKLTDPMCMHLELEESGKLEYLARARCLALNQPMRSLHIKNNMSYAHKMREHQRAQKAAIEVKESEAAATKAKKHADNVLLDETVGQANRDKRRKAALARVGISEEAPAPGSKRQRAENAPTSPQAAAAHLASSSKPATKKKTKSARAAQRSLSSTTLEQPGATRASELALDDSVLQSKEAEAAEQAVAATAAADLAAAGAAPAACQSLKQVKLPKTSGSAEEKRPVAQFLIGCEDSRAPGGVAAAPLAVSKEAAGVAYAAGAAAAAITHIEGAGARVPPPTALALKLGAGLHDSSSTDEDLSSEDESERKKRMRKLKKKRLLAEVKRKMAELSGDSSDGGLADEEKKRMAIKDAVHAGAEGGAVHAPSRAPRLHSEKPKAKPAKRARQETAFSSSEEEHHSSEDEGGENHLWRRENGPTSEPDSDHRGETRSDFEIENEKQWQVENGPSEEEIEIDADSDDSESGEWQKGQSDSEVYHEAEARCIKLKEAAKKRPNAGNKKKAMGNNEENKLKTSLCKAASVSSSSSEPLSLDSIDIPGDPILPIGKKKWNTLTDKQRTAALNLGFSKDGSHKMHWDSVRRAWNGGESYLPEVFANALLSVLSKKQRAALLALDIRIAAFECLSANGVIANHARTWRRLTTEARIAARLLGFQVAQRKETHVWDCLGPEGVESQWEMITLCEHNWRRLSIEQKEAAKKLDWTKASWNLLVQNIAKAKQGRKEAREARGLEKRKAKAQELKKEKARREAKKRKVQPRSSYAPPPPGDDGGSSSSSDSVSSSESSASEKEEKSEAKGRTKESSSSEEEEDDDVDLGAGSDKSYLQTKAQSKKEQEEAALQNAGGDHLKKPSDSVASGEKKPKVKKVKDPKSKTPVGASPSTVPSSPAPSMASVAASDKSDVSLGQSYVQGFKDATLERAAMGFSPAPEFGRQVPKVYLKGGFYLSAQEKSGGLLSHSNRLINRPNHLPARKSVALLMNPTTPWEIKLWMPVADAYVQATSKTVLAVGASGISVETGNSEDTLSNVHFHLKDQFCQAVQARTMAMAKCPVTTCQGFVPKSQLGPLFEYSMWLQQLCARYNLEGIALLDKQLMEDRDFGTWDFEQVNKPLEILRNLLNDYQLPQADKHCLFCSAAGHTVDNCSFRNMPKELVSASITFKPSGNAVCRNYNVGNCNAGANCSQVRSRNRLHARSYLHKTHSAHMQAHAGARSSAAKRRTPATGTCAHAVTHSSYHSQQHMSHLRQHAHSQTLSAHMRGQRGWRARVAQARAALSGTARPHNCHWQERAPRIATECHRCSTRDTHVAPHTHTQPASATASTHELG